MSLQLALMLRKPSSRPAELDKALRRRRDGSAVGADRRRARRLLCRARPIEWRWESPVSIARPACLRSLGRPRRPLEGPPVDAAKCAPPERLARRPSCIVRPTRSLCQPIHPSMPAAALFVRPNRKLLSFPTGRLESPRHSRPKGFHLTLTSAPNLLPVGQPETVGREAEERQGQPVGAGLPDSSQIGALAGGAADNGRRARATRRPAT